MVHRSDGSGTTFLFTDYLGKVSDEWKSKVGSNTSVKWPTGIGGKGNEGVAGTVSQTKGAIGYVEYAYVKQNKMAFLKMINRDGKTVSPGSEAVQAAAAGADWAGTPGMAVIITDAPGAASWPMAGATFIVMYKQPKDAAASAAALKFFDWAYKTRRQDGRGARLCADAGQRREPDPQGLDRDQGRRRQAALRHVNSDVPAPGPERSGPRAFFLDRRIACPGVLPWPN